MRNSAQPFDCRIANKTVRITWRHGGGLLEPAKAYVRCDERDCQYADLNEAPCPLRVDMFADGSERRVAEYLSERAGSHFCYACLIQILGLNHNQLRRASWTLIGHTAFSVRSLWCANCRRRRVTMGFSSVTGSSPIRNPSSGHAEAPGIPGSRSPLTSELIERLGTYLRAHRGFSFCVHCLSRELGPRLALMREAIHVLETLGDFPAHTAQCVNCLIVKPVIRYERLAESPDAAQRVRVLLRRDGALGFCLTCVAFACEI